MKVRVVINIAFNLLSLGKRKKISGIFWENRKREDEKGGILASLSECVKE